MENAILEVLSVRFVLVFIFLSRGRFLRLVLGRVFTLIGGFCGLWLQFG